VATDVGEVTDGMAGEGSINAEPAEAVKAGVGTGIVVGSGTFIGVVVGTGIVVVAVIGTAGAGGN